VAGLSLERIAKLLQPYVPGQAPGNPLNPLLPPTLLDQLSTYLDLLLRWNSRVSLTSIRTPEEIVQRHFGESLFTGFHLARHLPGQAQLLDYGSGAGFPGLPIQLLFPNLQVTLAESQARKVAFLREVIRTLSLHTEVWPKRVEEMPAERRFDAITLRAVDRMDMSQQEAPRYLRPGGWLALLTTETVELALEAVCYALPNSEHRKLILRQGPMFHVEHRL
jgi:16S rRNA (guanine527-N7)-methyltransferase